MGMLEKLLVGAGATILAVSAIATQSKKSKQSDRDKKREQLFSEWGIGVANGKPYMTKDFIEGAMDRGKGNKPKNTKNSAYMNGYTGSIFTDIDEALKEIEKK